MTIRTSETVYGVREGDKYGLWTVLGCPFGFGLRRWAVVVACQCGRIAVVLCYDLRRGTTQACRSCSTSIHRPTHGEYGTPLYWVWAAIKQRCHNPNNRSYADYGGRGIRLCDAWEDFPAFKEWANENGYAAGLEIDRVNNDGHYEPGNCRWTTKINNSHNTRRSRLLLAFGETKCIAEWSRDDRCVVKPNSLKTRLSKGWSLEAAMTTPPLKSVKSAQVLDYADSSVVTQV